MNKIKKVLAMLLTLAMVLGMSVTAFAAGTPKDTDKVQAEVTNVEAGATVTAYQIVKADYNENGFIGYSEVKEGTIADVKAPTSAEIVLLSKNVSNLPSVPMSLLENGNYGAELNAGYWMVIVEGTANKIYNPMLLGVYYYVGGSDNTMVGDPVDASKNWELTTTNAYAKSSDITLTKTVDDKEAEVTNDIVEFEIVSEIPSYSEQYEAPVFVIEDTIENGLEYTAEEPVVKVGGTTLTKNTEYRVEKDADSFKITFDPTYVSTLAGANINRAVEITYKAKLTVAAVSNVGKNKVTLTYSNNPTTTTVKNDTEYVYTFSMNGVLKKLGQDEDANGLAGAEFTLYRENINNQLSDVFGTYTTTADNNYDIYFAGLDSDETYYLKETKAPDNYTINETVYTITFEKVDYTNKEKPTYEVVVNGNKRVEVTYGAKAEVPADQVLNTKISTLPSTGGIGTTIFTVAGCLIMVAAAGMFFVSRRKESK